MFKIENMTSLSRLRTMSLQEELRQIRGKRSERSSAREMTDVTIFSVTPKLKNRRYHFRGITVNNFINTQ